MGDNNLYVVITERDAPENGRPIVFEQYLDQGAADLERVQAFRASLGDKYGKTRIAKLQFIED